MKKLALITLLLLLFLLCTSCKDTDTIEPFSTHIEVDRLINESERRIGYMDGIKFAITHIKFNDTINLNVIAEELYITSKELDSLYTLTKEKLK